MERRAALQSQWWGVGVDDTDAGRAAVLAQLHAHGITYERVQQVAEFLLTSEAFKCWVEGATLQRFGTDALEVWEHVNAWPQWCRDAAHASLRKQITVHGGTYESIQEIARCARSGEHFKSGVEWRVHLLGGSALAFDGDLNALWKACKATHPPGKLPLRDADATPVV